MNMVKSEYVCLKNYLPVKEPKTTCISKYLHQMPNMLQSISLKNAKVLRFELRI